MGRKKLENKRKIAKMVRFNESDLKQIAKVLKAEKTTFSRYVRQAFGLSNKVE